MRLGYLYSRYPVISQTFCDAEMLALERRDIELVIGSVYPPLTSLRHEHIARLRAPIHYAPPQEILRILERDAKTSRKWPRDFVEHHDGKYGPGAKAEQRARNALYFAEFFARSGVDHVHVHFANRAAHTALFLKEISGIPFSITAHGQDFMKDLGSDDLLREICAAAEFVAAETDYSRDLLRQRCPDSAAKIHRVYNGIDLERFPVPRSGDGNRIPRIVSVGRLVAFKGFDDLIDACAELARRRIDFVCDIIGDGPLRETLQAKIEQLDLSSRVNLLGSLSQDAVLEKLQAADIFALASTTDTQGATDVFPTVILEAMASARPVVSTRLAGIPELVVDGQTGMLVPPGDSVALAANEMLNGKIAGGYGHMELAYDFDAGSEADGWLHALFRYEDLQTGHAAETSFGAHVFNTLVTYKGEPQSYKGPPPGLSTRLFLRVGRAPYDTLCHLIYPASLPWHETSDTVLTLTSAAGSEIAKRALKIACGGSALWRVNETFSAAERKAAGDNCYVVVRDTTCRLFGYHGLIGERAFSLDHMFGF